MATLQAGTITSVDLTVSKADEVRDFYERVIGWTHSDVEMGDYSDYMMIAPDGQPTGGICFKQGVNAALPSVWMVYFLVDDVNASMQTVERLGGKVLVRPEPTASYLYAVIQDPAGATCALFQMDEATKEYMAPHLEKAAETATQPGKRAWVDLTVEDAEGVRDFYQQVLGWTPQEVPMEGKGGNYNDYNMCDTDGNPVVGICHKQGGNQDIPSQWMAYFVVPDVDASVKAVEAGGGKVLTSHNMGSSRMAIIQDPAGAVCSLFQPE
jgi:predicted enzyme related to lactoylglutathione lyase